MATSYEFATAKTTFNFSIEASKLVKIKADDFSVYAMIFSDYHFISLKDAVIEVLKDNLNYECNCLLYPMGTQDEKLRLKEKKAESTTLKALLKSKAFHRIADNEIKNYE